MSLYHFNHQLPLFKNAVITIGSFDGVHNGHRKILQKVVDEAVAINGESVVITFYPHPRKVINPEAKLSLVTTQKEKYEQIFKLGINHIVEVPFSRDFSMLSATEFIQDFLVKKFQPKKIVIGYDHHFGHDRKGNIDLLKKELEPTIEIIEITAKLIDDAAISSTKIRTAIANGAIATANEMLGRPFQINGVVIHSKKLGRKLGFPTANLKLIENDILLPPKGIYAVKAVVQKKLHNAVMSIGNNPTVTDSQRLNYEVHIFDFDTDIYGEELTVLFYQKIRDEQKFHNIDDLVEQMKRDEVAARAILNRILTIIPKNYLGD